MVRVVQSNKPTAKAWRVKPFLGSPTCKAVAKHLVAAELQMVDAVLVQLTKAADAVRGDWYVPFLMRMAAHDQAGVLELHLINVHTQHAFGTWRVAAHAMVVVHKRRAAPLAVLVYLHPQPTRVTSDGDVAAVLVYDVRHTVERTGVHALLDVGLVVATAEKFDDVLVLGQELGAVFDDVVEVRDAFVLWAYVAVAAARIVLTTHQVEPVAKNEHRRVRSLGFVKVPAQHHAVAFYAVIVDVRNKQHTLRMLVQLYAVDGAADLFNLHVYSQITSGSLLGSSSTCMNVFAMPMRLNPASTSPPMMYARLRESTQCMSQARPRKWLLFFLPPTLRLCSGVLYPEFT